MIPKYPIDIKKKIIEKYCHQLFGNQIDNLGEKNKVFERHKLSMFIQEYIDNLYDAVSLK